MELYLLRHGVAAELGEGGVDEDAARPLTTEGVRKVTAVARGMEALGLTFDLVLTSPAVRARDTARIVARRLGLLGVLRPEPGLSPGARVPGVVGLLAGLSPAPERLLLVGHEPWLGELVSVLTTGGPGLALTFKKAGLCRLTLGRVIPGRCGELDWLLTPRHLAAIG